MTTEQLQSLGPALADFLQRFLFCCAYTQTFDHLQVYCRGLLSDLPRKGVEPMARAAGTPVRTLQEFLRDHVWSRTQVRDLLQDHVRDFLAGVFVLLEDQYGVGDLIDAGSATGRVEAVSLRSTQLRDIRGTLWHIPNGQIARVGR